MTTSVDGGGITFSDASQQTTAFQGVSNSGTTNTALGYTAGNLAAVTGTNNVSVGIAALFSSTTGSSNTAVGYEAGYWQTAANNNSFSGYQAGLYVTNSNNTAHGYQALYSAGTLTNAGSFVVGQTYTINLVGTTDFTLIGAASNTVGVIFTATGVGAGTGKAILNVAGNGFNVANGYQAMYSNTTGNRNTANGYQALYSNTTGYWNTATGYQALYSNTTGYWNTANGYQALYSNTTGVQNTATGWQALYSNTTGDANTATGIIALTSNTTGTNNTATGKSAMHSNTTGNLNVAIGYFALGSNTVGNYNTAIGYSALGGNTIGNGNIGIGGVTAAGARAPAFDIGTQNNYASFGSTALTNAYIQVAWSPVSDARDKLPQGPVPHGIDFVNQLKPTSFYFKESRENPVPNGRLRYGFLAQDILEIEGDNPVIIDNQLEEKFYFNEADLIPVLVNAIKDQQHMIEELKQEMAALKASLSQ